MSSSNTWGIVRNFTYDARGNATGVGPYAFDYDHSNQPVSVAGGAGGSYAYDANLKRAKSVLSDLRAFYGEPVPTSPESARAGKTVYALYSRVAGTVVYRDEVTDSKKTDYASAGGVSLRLANGVPEYTHADHLGSPIAATDASGAVTWRESYTPFGDARLRPAANDNNTGFTGHIADAATNLVYMQARYYDPWIGRFLSTDPIGYADQLNLYAYVANDPVNFTDPAGLAKCGSLEGDHCEQALDAADRARDNARDGAKALRGVAGKVADGARLSSAEQKLVDAVTSSFGDEYGSADKLTEVAGALDQIADRIGARGEGLTLNKGNEVEPNTPAYVDGPNAAALNKSFFDRGSPGKQITIFHEATHIEHGTWDAAYRGPALRGLVAQKNRRPREYDLRGNTDSYTCSIVAYRQAEC